MTTELERNGDALEVVRVATPRKVEREFDKHDSYKQLQVLLKQREDLLSLHEINMNDLDVTISTHLEFVDYPTPQKIPTLETFEEAVPMPTKAPMPQKLPTPHK